MKKKLSISDIAKQLGVSVTTVSFVLNGKAKEMRVSDTVAKRVQAYVNKVGYTLSSSNVRKKDESSRFIVFLVDDVSHPFYAVMAKEMASLVALEGYQFLCCYIGGLAPSSILSVLKDVPLSGCFLLASASEDSLLAGLLALKVPLVMLDKHIPDVELAYVGSEGVQSSYLGTLKLFGNSPGARVGCVTLHSTQLQLKDRLKGYMKAVDEVGADFYIKKINPSLGSLQVADDIRDFIMDNKLESVFFTTTDLAVAGLDAIRKEEALKVEILSFGDNVFFSWIDSPVHVILEDNLAIAQQGVKLLLDCVGEPTTMSQTVRLPCELIVR